jgi:hypothetical protein
MHICGINLVLLFQCNFLPSSWIFPLYLCHLVVDFPEIGTFKLLVLFHQISAAIYDDTETNAESCVYTVTLQLNIKNSYTV